eukprot:9468944-Pyramimonas_sp.AAC.3
MSCAKINLKRLLAAPSACEYQHEAKTHAMRFLAIWLRNGHLKLGWADTPIIVPQHRYVETAVPDTQRNNLAVTS